MGDEPVQVAFRDEVKGLHPSFGREVVFHHPLAMLLDSIDGVLVAEHLGRCFCGEVGLSLDFQHPQFSELAVLEYLHLVHV